MAIDACGIQYSAIECQLPSYSGVIAAYAGYASATDITSLQNPATSTNILRLTQVRITGFATAVAYIDVFLQQRTALDTGGTPTAITIGQHDTRDPAPLGLCTTYAAAPTLTGTVRNLRVDQLFVATNPGTPSMPEDLIWQWGDRSSKAPRLLPGQQLALNLNGVSAPAGMALYINWEWTEVPINGSVPVFP